MKIGAVCQATGLTDRAIRFYIEEGLLQPACAQNYLGRKSFDFTEENVTLLHQISVLRKYGFTINDIKTILADPSQSSGITKELIEIKKQTIQTERILLDTLLQLDARKDYTLPELAEALDSPVLADVKPPKDTDIPLVTWIFRWIFWGVWAFAMLIYLSCVFTTIKYHIQSFLYVKFYPFSWSTFVSILVWLFPFFIAALMLLLSSRGMQKKQVLQAILTISLTAAYLLIWMWFTVALIITDPLVYSETQDIENYMQIGAVERKSEMIPVLFPEEVPAHALAGSSSFLPDTTRYYNIIESPWGERYELFAQWQLSDVELESEKARLEKNFAGTSRHILENEDWVCWVFSAQTDGLKNHLRYALDGKPPIELEYYQWYIFAYRPRDGVVRYIASYSYDAWGIPIFMQLNWN